MVSPAVKYLPKVERDRRWSFDGLERRSGETDVREKEPEELQLPYLVTFSKAAELSNFSAAAQALRLSQAAVSQRVQALEKALDKSLFKRKGGRVLLTGAGQKLYEYAQRILDLHRETRREVSGHETPLSGELLLGASSVPGEYLLPALLSSFGQKHLHIKVRASVTDSMSVMAQVERGEVNLGLVGKKAENPHLEFRYFASDKMVLIVPPGHALSKRKKVSVKQLSDHAIILRESGSGLRGCFEKSLERVGWSLADFSVALELGSNEGIKEAVLRGVGVAILSTYSVQKELRAGTLLAVEVSDLRCDRDMFIVQDKRRVLPFPARLLLNFLESHPIPTIPLSP
ncbi:MAG: LysR family transcriptional regulator [Planctomycetes bacterium]|nr:LysR family transcriptional regulator [Planctomycetota bacterium]